MERESGTGKPAEPVPVEPPERLALNVAVDVDTLQTTYKAHIRGPYLRARDLMLLGRFKAAWNALRGIDEPDETRESRALDELIGACSIRVTDPRETAGFFEATLDLAQQAGDRASESRALYNIGVARFLAGQTAVAWRLFEQARTVAQSIPSRLCGSYACYGLYRVLERTGKAAEAEEMLRRVQRLLAEQQSAMVAMRIFLGAEYDCEMMAESLERDLRGKPGPFGAPVEERRRREVAEKAQERGHHRLAERLLESVRRSAHDAGRHKDEVLALYAIATNWMRQEMHAAAVPPLQRALAIEREHGTVTDVATILTVLGSALAASGDTAGGAARLVESYRYCRDHEDIERARQAAAELVAVAVKHGFFDELPGICRGSELDEAEFIEIMERGQEYSDLTFPPDPDHDPDDDDE
jgi:tetratricopeptide (TPR) repeat protein